MSLRSDWVAAKATAKTQNGKTEVKFSTKEDLGPLLDAYEAAQKAFIKLNAGKEDKAWAKAAGAYIAATDKATQAAALYTADLPKLKMTPAALNTLKTKLMSIALVLRGAEAEGKKLVPRIAKAG